MQDIKVAKSREILSFSSHLQKINEKNVHFYLMCILFYFVYFLKVERKWKLPLRFFSLYQRTICDSHGVSNQTYLQAKLKSPDYILNHKTNLGTVLPDSWNSRPEKRARWGKTTKNIIGIKAGLSREDHICLDYSPNILDVCSAVVQHNRCRKY